MGSMPFRPRAGDGPQAPMYELGQALVVRSQRRKGSPAAKRLPARTTARQGDATLHFEERHSERKDVGGGARSRLQQVTTEVARVALRIQGRAGAEAQRVNGLGLAHSKGEEQWKVWRSSGRVGTPEHAGVKKGAGLERGADVGKNSEGARDDAATLRVTSATAPRGRRSTCRWPSLGPDHLA